MSIRLRNVEKTFGGHRAVAGITADLGEGELFVVLGPSGCGKSTLLRLIAGLDQPDGGEIMLGGEVMTGADRHVAPEDRAVGVVFQSYALWPHMTVRDNVAFPAEARGAGRAEARRLAEGHLGTVDLTGFAARRPAELSGGQRQRVALARCLAGGARTILMDEPLANLDPHLRGRMEAEIAAFHRAAGVTTIYITHDQREAMALADRIAVMWEGRFLQVAPPEELHDRPACEQVARFIGRAAVIDGQVAREGDAWRATAGPLHAPLDEAPSCGPGMSRLVIRPGDVTLGQGVPARIERAFYRGGVWEGWARPDGAEAALPVETRRRLADGEAVALSLTGAWALPG